MLILKCFLGILARIVALKIESKQRTKVELKKTQLSKKSQLFVHSSLVLVSPAFNLMPMTSA